MESVKGLVSIIIPVYNGEKYLSRCLDSVLAQTYRDIEVILIDDGSADGTCRIGREYSEADNRVVMIAKENTGVSDTRNTGISHAKGEFIVFADSDDHVDSEYVSHLVSLMSSDVDLGITGWKKEDENGAFIEKCELLNSEYSPDGSLEKIVSVSSVQGYPFSRIFRTELIRGNNIEFNKDITMFEDLLFCCAYSKCIKKARINTGYCDYHYMIRESSARTAAVHSRTFDPAWLSEISALEILSGILGDSKKAKWTVRARIALSSSFYINRMFDCGYEDRKLRSDLQRNIRRNLFPVVFSSAGDFKWKMQALLCTVSPWLEYRLKRKP